MFATGCVNAPKTGQPICNHEATQHDPSRQWEIASVTLNSAGCAAICRLQVATQHEHLSK